MPVGFSPERINDSGMIGTIAGFGRTNTEPRPDELLYIESTSMTNAECRRFYSRNQNPFNAVRIFDSNICFTNPVGEGICGG